MRMKRFNLIMIILWCLIGAGILVILTATIFFDWRLDRSFSFSPSEAEIAVDETVGMDGIDTVKLSFAADNCRVFLTEDEGSLRVIHYARGIPEQRYAKISQQNNVLTVSTNAQFGIYLGIAPMTFSEVEVYLPKDYKEKLDIGMSSGTLNIDDAHDQSGVPLELSELSVSVSSGTIRIAKEITAPIVNIGLTSGTIHLTGGLTADNFTVKVSSGNISVGEKLAGSGNVTVTSGDVRLSGVDIAESLSVKVNSGTVNIGMAGDPSLQFTGRKNSGTIKTYFDTFSDGNTHTATVGEAPYKRLDVQVTSGTVRVTQD